MAELTKEDAVQYLIKNHNFHPNRKYKLKRLTETETRTGGTLLKVKNVQPAKHIELPRDPVTGWSIYDLRTKKDFSRYFEDEFQGFPDGRYAAYTGNKNQKGFAWFFDIEFRDNQVVKWRKKSRGENQSRHSSSYYAFPDYFRIRQDWGV